MKTAVTFSQVSVGDELTPVTQHFTRLDLVKYAGASGDFNAIHLNERIAHSVGLPDVIAHGMLTMGCAIQVVTNWVGNPTAVIDYSVRMTRPVVVPDTDEGTEVVFAGVIGAKNDDGTVRVDITATCEGQTVLGQAKALVRLSQ